MHSQIVRTCTGLALIAVALSAGTARSAEAAEGPGDARDNAQTVRHLRTVDSRLHALIVDGASRSPSFRTLVDRLRRSTVIVYVEARPLPGNLSGRLTFVGRGQRWRYLRIEIECRQSTTSQIAALGHELQHAIEIADAAAAVDQASIRTLYGTIGFATDDTQRRFESDAARDAGSRVRRELSLRIQTHTYDLP